MASTIASGCFESPPDFSYPPKYMENFPSVIKATTEQSQSKDVQKFGFPIHHPHTKNQNTAPTPTHLPEILTPLTPLDNANTVYPSILIITNPIPSPKPNLLTIPLEIRLQIYSYVLLSHPIHHAHLSPITTSSTAPPYVKKEIVHTIFRSHPQGLSYGPGISYPSPTSPSSIITFTSAPASSQSSPTKSISPSSALSHILTHPPLTPSHRRPTTQGKIPTALLNSCRQVYNETRLLPFQHSHFAFVNWFWSGIYAARQFSRGLKPWQSASIRYTSVEVLGRDLWSGAPTPMMNIGGFAGAALGNRDAQGTQEWRELCGLWGGVWGVRVGIKGSVVLDKGKRGVVEGGGGWNGEDGSARAQGQGGQGKEKGILDVGLDWVQDGLMHMESLRWIELEIEDEDVDRDTKLTFCHQLAQALNTGRDSSDKWEGNVKVIFVERVQVQDTKGDGKEFVYYGGEPGDDSNWSLGA